MVTYCIGVRLRPYILQLVRDTAMNSPLAVYDTYVLLGKLPSCGGSEMQCMRNEKVNDV